MNAAHVNPFLSATINLFQRTFGVTAEPGKPYLEDRALSHRWDISGVMVLTGNAIGVVAIRLTRLLADKLLDRAGMTWKTEEERHELVNGMVGELVNVVGGNAATELSGFNIEISVPVIVQGKNHTIAWPDREPIVGVPFNTPLGPFLVNLSLIELPKAYRPGCQ